MSFIVWHATGRFAVDVDGNLWKHYALGWLYLCPIAEVAEIVDDPDIADAAEIAADPDAIALADLWADRFDPREPQTFRRE